MKVVVLNNLNDEEFHEVIGRREVVTLSKNYLKRYYSADLFTECKRVTTAINRFFKALEKDYPAFAEFKEGIIEDVKQGIYELSLFSNDLKFAFAIEENEGCYYISVAVPMEQEQEEQEQTEAKEENTNMKDIKIKISWSKILKDENGWHDTDKEYIVLDIDVEGVTWDLGCKLMYTLEDKINEDNIYSCSREGCSDFDEERNTFSDCLFFERDYGSIKEQRKEVIKYVNSIKKEVIRKVLEQEAK